MPFRDHNIFSTFHHPNWFHFYTSVMYGLVQASGRVCRGMTDYGVTYIIDSNFMFLFKQNHDLFPEWWVNAMVIPKKK